MSEKNLIRIRISFALFCCRQRILPDLQREPQQVHQGGKCHLNNGGPVWSSCQRSAVSLGFRIACPEPQAPTLSGSHRHCRLGQSRPLWMWWKQSTPALGVQERHPLWSERQGPALKLGQQERKECHDFQRFGAVESLEDLRYQEWPLLQRVSR